MFLAQLGCTVIGVDKDLSRLNIRGARGMDLIARQHDLIAEPWPFGEKTIGGIILIDFLHIPLLLSFGPSLICGGYFLLETISGRGENHFELPEAGEIKAAVQKEYDLQFYRESPVGPKSLRKVSVKMLARRRD
jgi:hypothetical protein